MEDDSSHEHTDDELINLIYDIQDMDRYHIVQGVTCYFAEVVVFVAKVYTAWQ